MAQRAALGIAVHIKVGINRQHMAQPQPRGGFRNGCIGQVKRQIMEALTDLQHLGQGIG